MMHKYGSIFIDDRDVRMLRIPHVTSEHYLQTVKFFRARAESLLLKEEGTIEREFPREVTDLWIAGLVGTGASVIADISGLDFRLYFDVADEIRIYIEPCDYQNSEAIEKLLMLMVQLAKALEKKILLTANVEPLDRPVLEFLPSGDVIYNSEFDDFVEQEIENQKNMIYAAEALRKRAEEKKRS